MGHYYCSICGRPVHSTIHFKDSYTVDYYLEITGDTEPVVIASDEQDKPDSSYLKLVTVKEIVRCTDCMKRKNDFDKNTGIVV